MENIQNHKKSAKFHNVQDDNATLVFFFKRKTLFNLMQFIKKIKAKPMQ